MAENVAIARPYAQAIFELANSAGQLVAWSDVLHAAGAVVSDESVAGLIGAPATDEAKLAEMIGEIAARAADVGDAGQVTNLVKLLAENGRLTALPEIACAYDSLKAEVENRVEVTLTAANPVDDIQQVKIIEALKKRFGRDVSLTFELDESLIGGARLRANDLVIDGSVSTGLEKLATTLAT
ncbi:MAG: F0F1 ATP synthase subunit delta [Gammaproteobacteria bacterium]|jgi:F-type H+-transporting ATPase subunit delta|nr:F0F1 ATP synthase subunit delta [Chromatiales bacterium]MDP6150198.1 F0F1 ATP synthase subunit delta [Gammaproteobacteria bacterium]MDP7153564.1 F0F1 ATP synthase subunit delta [Gammaproteobacteria bacterium]MDP7270954.1 F0F1 ATP synthase subunit delta [Gammaproteobacteria bacterium]MDP7418865.1 F0F1 ATP synthase subunit delta [Gammaproteobacteria bacterium]